MLRRGALKEPVGHAPNVIPQGLPLIFGLGQGLTTLYWGHRLS
jgi:hypothetical protein